MSLPLLLQVTPTDVVKCTCRSVSCLAPALCLCQARARLPAVGPEAGGGPVRLAQQVSATKIPAGCSELYQLALCSRPACSQTA